MSFRFAFSRPFACLPHYWRHGRSGIIQPPNIIHELWQKDNSPGTWPGLSAHCGYVSGCGRVRRVAVGASARRAQLGGEVPAVDRAALRVLAVPDMRLRIGVGLSALEPTWTLEVIVRFRHDGILSSTSSGCQS